MVSRFVYKVINRPFSAGLGTKLPSERANDRDDCNAGNERIYKIQGVIFDMDGTLTLPVLDFAKLRRMLNVAEGTDILKSVNAMDHEKKEQYYKIIEEFENEGLESLALQPHCVEMLHYVSIADVKRALVTRNSRKSVDIFLTKLQEEMQQKLKDEESIWPLFSEVGGKQLPIS